MPESQRTQFKATHSAPRARLAAVLRAAFSRRAAAWIAAGILVCSASGCQQNALVVDLLEQQNRYLEDEIYALEAELDDIDQELSSTQRENATLRRLVSDGRASDDWPTTLGGSSSASGNGTNDGRRRQPDKPAQNGTGQSAPAGRNGTGAQADEPPMETDDAPPNLDVELPDPAANGEGNPAPGDGTMGFETEALDGQPAAYEESYGPELTVDQAAGGYEPAEGEDALHVPAGPRSAARSTVRSRFRTLGHVTDQAHLDEDASTLEEGYSAYDHSAAEDSYADMDHAPADDSLTGQARELRARVQELTSRFSGDNRAAESDPIPVKLVLNPRLTGGYNADHLPGDEGITAYVELLNQSGARLMVPGELSLVLLDPQAEGEQARVARWDFEAEDCKDLIRKTALGVGLYAKLHWPSEPPNHRKLALYARFITDSGQTLLARHLIDVNPFAEQGADWEPPGENPEQSLDAAIDQLNGRQSGEPSTEASSSSPVNSLFDESAIGLSDSSQSDEPADGPALQQEPGEPTPMIDATQNLPPKTGRRLRRAPGWRPVR